MSPEDPIRDSDADLLTGLRALYALLIGWGLAYLGLYLFGG